MRVTKAMLEHQNAMLRRDLRQLRQELDIAQQRATLHIKAYSLLEKHTSTMTIAAERVTDALSHVIGFTTDPKRQRANTRESDLPTHGDVNQERKRWNIDT